MNSGAIPSFNAFSVAALSAVVYLAALLFVLGLTLDVICAHWRGFLNKFPSFTRFCFRSPDLAFGVCCHYSPAIWSECHCTPPPAFSSSDCIITLWVPCNKNRKTHQRIGSIKLDHWVLICSLVCHSVQSFKFLVNLKIVIGTKRQFLYLLEVQNCIATII